MDFEKIKKYNLEILSKTAKYLSDYPCAISGELVLETARRCKIPREEAFRVIASGVLDVFECRDLMRYYISEMFTLLDAEKYERDEYYKNISLGNIRRGGWSVTERKYLPYEAFVFDDLKKLPDGRMIPQVGFFDREFLFPCIMQDGREWMTVTPNEIETMKHPISRARGRVLTYGLGLGYFAYMASQKKEVSSVTVIEREKDAISLFEDEILPQFPNREKITVICGDAVEYAMKKEKYDFVFADIWHDPTDATEPYLLLKSLERADTEYAYWIEKTIKCYI